MDADLEDLHPSMRKIMEQNEEYMATQKKKKAVMTPPANFEEIDFDEEER